MTILSEAKRKKYFRTLGLGEYNNTNLRKLQKTYLRAQDVDGVYGKETDRLLRHLYNVKICAPSFKPTEFKCTCGKCNGYPSYMKRVTLRHIQRIRNHYNRPMIITSGLRCKYANGASTGSIDNSLHLVGRAVDFYMAGVTDSLANRKKSIKYIKTLPNHHYTYGNGINSNGVAVYAPYMGNALHTDTNKEPKKKKTDPLQKWYDAMKTQFDWSKNQTYKFVVPTVASSKKNGTCITFPAVSLQRLGLLPKGKYFYFHPQHKRISGSGADYVKGHKDIYLLFYPHKTAAQLGDKLKKGDIIGFGQPAYHTMVYMGKNGKGRPRYNTMGHKKGLNTLYNMYASRKIDMVVRLKKVSK